jgi:hypothetical protein
LFSYFIDLDGISYDIFIVYPKKDTEGGSAYLISKDIELPGPYTIDILKPAGERIYTEVEQKFIPHRHWGRDFLKIPVFKKLRHERWDQ